jgi:hypothetical protein
VTKQNPRPRKYASDAEKQAAYRSRAAEVCVRLEPKTMATLDSIADEIGYTRNELMQSMVKFGLTNRDWRNEGLTAHKRLPRYQENPDMATKPPSAAQLAARARFAEMARNGSLNRKRQVAAKQNAGVKRNPTKKTPAIKYGSYGGDPKTKHAFVDGAEVIIFPIKKSETDFYDAPEWARAIVEVFGDANHDNSQYPVGSVQNGKDNIRGFVADSKKRSSNPAKKTVSQKISQLVHEGYPQKQAVAVALNEQRAGKVKRNPANAITVEAYAVICKDERLKTWHTVAIATNEPDAVEIAQLLANRKKRQYAVQVRYVRAKDFEVY